MADSSERKSPIITTARPASETISPNLEEMEGAAAAVVAMVLANRQRMSSSAEGVVGSKASKWTIRGRLENTRRWW